MSSIAIHARAHAHPHLRPLNVLHDLPAVADLIETCFSSTMDSEGQKYVQDMRRVGKDNSFIKWANHAIETTSLPLSGYVWEEGGKIVGNASLIPFRNHQERIYLIANVATHPEHRRQGIARQLTERAVQHAREKNINDIWLHVRHDNPGAIELYKKLGFMERAQRTSWQAATDPEARSPQTGITTAKRNPNDWQTQRSWLLRLYPESLAWHRNWTIAALRPGLWNWLYRLFIDMNVQQWTAIKNNKMEAALAWMPYGRSESLFAAIGEQSDPSALTAVLLRARRELAYSQPNLMLEFPSGKFDRAIQAAGFKPLRTLIWMQATL